MKKIATFTSTYDAYNVPFTRTARIYESDTPVFKGAHYEVSTHNGSAKAEWEFKPFKSLTEAQVYALQYVSPSHLSVGIN